MANLLKFITDRFSVIPLSGYMYFVPKPERMKTKLLKRIRKQFAYYLNDNGDYVIINHYAKTVEVMNLEFFVNLYRGSTEKQITKHLENPKNRFFELKKYFLGRYGYDKNKKLYRKAILNYKRYMKKKRIDITISDAK